MGFILGISITFNILSLIAFIFIYKYSFKKIKNNLENMLINNFVDEGVKEYREGLNNLESGFVYDHK